jgi:predicted enzyme related to lactoylglutathione lyase
MVEKTHHEPGSFCWVELATSDAAAAKSFYTSLFGWSVNEFPVGEGMTYSMLEKNGKQAGALYQLGPQQKGVPPHWNSYVCVASADDAAAHAKELGARVVMEPFDVMDNGRMAVVQDPTGAVFSLWQPGASIGARVVNEPGSFCWNELYTRDPKKAADFYSGLFGWKMNARHMDFGDYVIFENSEGMMAGMLKIAEEWGPVPPYWLVYFSVDDCDKAVDRAKGLGAKVTMPPMEIETAGRFALLSDPQGAGFAVIQLKAA